MHRLIAPFLAAAVAAAHAAPAPAPVPAGKLFKGEVLDIRSPNSDGWMLSTATPGTWNFIRQGPGRDETWGATITAFRTDAGATTAQFAAQVEDGANKNTSAARFVKHASTWEIDASRGYDCVRNRASYDDTKATLPSGGTATQLLQAVSLYCHHPRRPELGFAITFSHRGGAPDDHIDQEGADFAAGIQVPAAPDAAASAPN